MSTESIDGSMPNDQEFPTGRVADRLPDAIPGSIGAVVLGIVTFVGAMGLQIAVIAGFFVVAVLVGVASGDTATARTAGTMVGWGMLAGYLVWIPIVAGIVWFFDLPLPIRVPDVDSATWGAVSFVVLGGLAVASYLFLPHNTGALAGGGGSNVQLGAIAVAGIFAALVVGGVIEEFLFRGTIQGLFRDEFSAPAAILGANVLFVPLHFFNNLGQPPITMVVNLAVVGLLGVVAGVLYERHRNVVVPAAVHGAYNAVVVGSSFLL